MSTACVRRHSQQKVYMRPLGFRKENLTISVHINLYVWSQCERTALVCEKNVNWYEGHTDDSPLKAVLQIPSQSSCPLSSTDGGAHLTLVQRAKILEDCVNYFYVIFLLDFTLNQLTSKDNDKSSEKSSGNICGTCRWKKWTTNFNISYFVDLFSCHFLCVVRSLHYTLNKMLANPNRLHKVQCVHS